MGLEDIPFRDSAARELAAADIEELNTSGPHGFRMERAQLRMQGMLDNGLSQRETERLRQLLEPPTRFQWYQQQLARGWASTRLRFAAGAIATAAAGTVVWVATGTDVPPASNAWFSADSQAHLHRLEDGSSIVLSAGARGKLTKSDEEVHFALNGGVALFDVVPNQARRWRVTAHNYEVIVVGTRFSVGYDPSRGLLDVEVEHGVVNVRVPGQESPFQLAAGDFLAATDDGVTLRHGQRAAHADRRQSDVLDPEGTPGRKTGLGQTLDESGADERAGGHGAQAGDERSDEAAAREGSGDAQSAPRTETAQARPEEGNGKVSELQLLSRARTAIAADKHEAAIRWIRAHQQRFPNGQLIEEREALRVKALRGMGQEQKARQAAGEFRQRFPKSVLSPQMPTDAR
jgi:ferric-dicitrate binding protein FerR (iron transport regulator)